MNGGKLTQQIHFLSYELVSDGAGGSVLDETPIHELCTYAQIRQIKASRVAENLQEGINAVYEIKLRQRCGFSPQGNYTIDWGDKSLEIVEITEDVAIPRQWVIIAIHRGTGI